jgi:hypothetical protein
MDVIQLPQSQIKELVGICKEYVIALRCELKRKELKEDDMARAAELAAYFTHCNLQVGWMWVWVCCVWWCPVQYILTWCRGGEVHVRVVTFHLAVRGLQVDMIGNQVVCTWELLLCAGWGSEITHCAVSRHKQSHRSAGLRMRVALQNTFFCWH